MINEIIKDIKSIKNSLNNYIQVVDVLNELKPFEVSKAYKERVLNEIEKDDYEDFYKFITSNNTYNWNAFIDHDINYYIYQYNNNIYVVLKVHRYGDVRGNYTDEAVLIFNDVNEFYEALSSSDIYNEFKLSNGVTLYYDLNFFSSVINVYDKDDLLFESWCFDDIESQYNELYN